MSIRVACLICPSIGIGRSITLDAIPHLYSTDDLTRELTVTYDLISGLVSLYNNRNKNTCFLNKVVKELLKKKQKVRICLLVIKTVGLLYNLLINVRCSTGSP